MTNTSTAAVERLIARVLDTVPDDELLAATLRALAAERDALLALQGEAAPVALGWTCPNCGANIDAAWTFCGVCQTSKQPAQEAPQSLVGWLYDYAGEDRPPYKATISFADLVNFAAELDRRQGAK